MATCLESELCGFSGLFDQQRRLASLLERSIRISVPLRHCAAFFVFATGQNLKLDEGLSTEELRGSSQFLEV